MSRIEQLISDIEAYIDNCKYQPFSNNKIIVDKDQLEDMLSELRLKTPDEIKKYQKILNNKDAIISDAKEQAESILNAAQIQTEELINEHEIMQRAYAQANQLIEQATAQAQRILDSATEDANNIRIGAVQYTDDMLGKLQYIIEHSIKDNKEKYTSLMTGLENVLTVFTNNRKELVVEDEEPQQETAEQAEAVEDDSEDVVYEESSTLYEIPMNKELLAMIKPLKKCKVSIDTLHFFFSLANLNPYLRCMKEDIRMRQKWLELYVETGSVTKTALRCGITRSTLYRWINCEKEQGKSELSDKSKRSSRLANMKITPEIETIILNLCVRQEDGERNGLPTICLGRE